jgi:carbohydrate-binding DOMON domain-containing protein
MPALRTVAPWTVALRIAHWDSRNVETNSAEIVAGVP